MSNDKKVDLKRVFEAKNPKLAKKLPDFLFVWLEKMMYLHMFNYVITAFKDFKGPEFGDKILSFLEVECTVHGKENVPADGNFIFASNHPLGGQDGLALLTAVDNLKGPTKFLVNDILMVFDALKENFVPINKHGSQKDSVDQISAAYEGDNQVCIFPSGLASRKIDGKIIDLDWNKHVIVKSKQYKRDIIPVFIDAKNSNLFYNVGTIRKRFKIKLNLEMLILPREIFTRRRKPINIYFGKPISYKTFDKSHKPIEWAQIIKNKTYSIKN